MPDENYQNSSNLSRNISYLLIETFESESMEDLTFAYFFKIKDPGIFLVTLGSRNVALRLLILGLFF